MLRLLLDTAPESATVTDACGSSAASLAAFHGRRSALKFLLTAAPSLAVTPDNEGRYPAYLAAEAGHASCLNCS